MHGVLREHTTSIFPNDPRYSLVFDKLEILIALSFVNHTTRLGRSSNWAPPGAFGYRHQNRERILQEIEESISALEDRSPFVESGIFGDTAVICRRHFDAFKEFSNKLADQWL